MASQPLNPLVSLGPLLYGPPPFKSWYPYPPPTLWTQCQILKLLQLPPCLTVQNLLLLIDWSLTIAGSDPLLASWLPPPLVILAMIFWSFCPVYPDIYPTPPPGPSTINWPHQKPVEMSLSWKITALGEVGKGKLPVLKAKFQPGQRMGKHAVP